MTIDGTPMLMGGELGALDLAARDVPAEIGPGPWAGARRDQRRRLRAARRSTSRR